MMPHRRAKHLQTLQKVCHMIDLLHRKTTYLSLKIVMQIMMKKVNIMASYYHSSWYKNSSNSFKSYPYVVAFKLQSMTSDRWLPLFDGITRLHMKTYRSCQAFWSGEGLNNLRCNPKSLSLDWSSHLQGPKLLTCFIVALNFPPKHL